MAPLVFSATFFFFSPHVREFALCRLRNWQRKHGRGRHNICAYLSFSFSLRWTSGYACKFTQLLPSHVVAKCGKKSKTSPVFPNGKRSLTGGGGKTIGSTQKERKRAFGIEGGGRRWAGLIGSLSATSTRTRTRC